MDITIQQLDDCPLEILDGARVFEADGATVALCEVLNKAQEPAFAKTFAVGRNVLGRLVALDEVFLGQLQGGERHPARLCLSPLGGEAIAGVYVGVYRTIPTCQGTGPSAVEGRLDERGDG